MNSKTPLLPTKSFRFPSPGRDHHPVNLPRSTEPARGSPGKHVSVEPLTRPLNASIAKSVTMMPGQCRSAAPPPFDSLCHDPLLIAAPGYLAGMQGVPVFSGRRISGERTLLWAWRPPGGRPGHPPAGLAGDAAAAVPAIQNLPYIRKRDGYPILFRCLETSRPRGMESWYYPSRFSFSYFTCRQISALPSPSADTVSFASPASQPARRTARAFPR